MPDTEEVASPFQRIPSDQAGSGLVQLWKLYRLRWKRRRFLFRALRKRRQLRNVVDRTSQITTYDILLFACVRNEIERLPYFMDHYRRLGVTHFFFVDNASTDGTTSYLQDHADVSLWSTDDSYRMSRFGVDWLAYLQFRYGHGHWCLTVDADELLVFPGSEHRTLPDLIRRLEARGQVALGAIMLDMFPKGPIGKQEHIPGSSPIAAIPWFDPVGYGTRRHYLYENEWIQGGPRARYFFASEPGRAPTLNKFPLVKWNRRYAYVNSTHQILPSRLHRQYDPVDRQYMSGALLHTKFLPNIVEKSAEEMERQQHFQNSEAYQDYHRALTEGPDLWVESAEKYVDSHQLVALGLISEGLTRDN